MGCDLYFLEKDVDEHNGRLAQNVLSETLKDMSNYNKSLKKTNNDSKKNVLGNKKLFIIWKAGEFRPKNNRVNPKGLFKSFKY